MTLRLILIRHAKSSWDDPLLDDHDRTLNERGRKSAHAIGKWLADKHYLPVVVLCSSARRTVETWKILTSHIDNEAAVEISSGLYLASAHRMLTLLSKQHEATVLMLGHNPGTGSLAAGLISRRPAHTQFNKYPTAATSIIDFNVANWAAVTPGSGELVDFVVPRDLV